MRIFFGYTDNEVVRDMQSKNIFHFNIHQYHFYSNILGKKNFLVAWFNVVGFFSAPAEGSQVCK